MACSVAMKYALALLSVPNRICRRWGTCLGRRPKTLAFGRIVIGALSALLLVQAWGPQPALARTSSEARRAPRKEKSPASRTESTPKAQSTRSKSTSASTPQTSPSRERFASTSASASLTTSAKGFPAPPLLTSASRTLVCTSTLTSAPRSTATSSSLTSATRQAHVSTSTLAHQLDQLLRQTDALRDALIEKNETKLKQGLSELCRQANALQADSKQYPLAMELRLGLIVRMYQEGAKLVEDGQARNEPAMVQMGLERLDRANSELELTAQR